MSEYLLTPEEQERIENIIIDAMTGSGGYKIDYAAEHAHEITKSLLTAKVLRIQADRPSREAVRGYVIDASPNACPRCGHDLEEYVMADEATAYILSLFSEPKVLSDKLRIYVAGKWEDGSRVSEIMRIFEGMGCEITCDWTDHKYSDEAYPQQYCTDDLNGVKSADLYLGIFVEDYNYRGALVEMGIALGCGVPVWLFGDKADSCIFASHNMVRKFKEWGELAEAIAQAQLTKLIAIIREARDEELANMTDEQVREEVEKCLLTDEEILEASEVNMFLDNGALDPDCGYLKGREQVGP